MYIKKSEKIPFAWECEFEDYRNNRELILNTEFKEAHPADVLIVHHTTKNTFIHYTNKENVESILKNGILLKYMNAYYNDFGGNIHCFTADCPDGKWGEVPIYFTADEWWMCVANKDTTFNIRHCIINQDILPENIALNTSIKQISAKEYMKYFGYSDEEISKMSDTDELVQLATHHNNGTFEFLNKKGE